MKLSNDKNAEIKHLQEITQLQITNLMLSEEKIKNELNV